MKHSVVIIVVGFAFFSCDPVYRAEIKNETKQDILIEVGFDRQELEKSWNGKPYIPFLKSYPNDGLVENAIQFDTVNLTKTYRISPGLSFPLETGISSHPEYELFRSLQIIYQDTLTFSNRTQISGTFRKIGKRHWLMTVMYALQQSL